MNELTVDVLREHCRKLFAALFSYGTPYLVESPDDSGEGYEAWIQLGPGLLLKDCMAHGATACETLEALRSLLIRRSEEVAKALREVTAPPFVRPDFDDLFLKYDIILRTWPALANTITIGVTRRTGSPAHWKIDNQPKTGADLYDALRALHGPNDEATYDVKFTDAGRFRGLGCVTMPDARPRRLESAHG